MAEPDFKTQDALNESRILVLGVQVLLSFQYSSFLESSFTICRAHLSTSKSSRLDC